MIICKDEDIPREPQASYATATTPNIKVTFQSSGKIVYVAFGDITKVTTDVIVNAANSGLLHRGGLAKAISNAGEYDAVWRVTGLSFETFCLVELIFF